MGYRNSQLTTFTGLCIVGLAAAVQGSIYLFDEAQGDDNPDRINYRDFFNGDATPLMNVLTAGVALGAVLTIGGALSYSWQKRDATKAACASRQGLLACPQKPATQDPGAMPGTANTITIIHTREAYNRQSDETVVIEYGFSVAEEYYKIHVRVMNEDPENPPEWSTYEDDELQLKEQPSKALFEDESLMEKLQQFALESAPTANPMLV